MYKPVPPTKNGKLPRSRISLIFVSAYFLKSATENGSSGDTKSRPQCGALAISEALGLAVPISKPF